MARHGDQSRQALLDAAEELFATQGIDSVSNRRIAEFAGQANHSAVAYHFGGRDDLIRAIFDRHEQPVRGRRAELAARLPADPEVTDHLRCLVVPVTDHLATLPAPTWWARLIRQLRTTPSTATLTSDIITSDPVAAELVDSLLGKLGDLPPNVLAGRTALLGRMIIDVCAEYEAKVHAGTEQPQWTALGHFLTDACAGMLTAPVTHPDQTGFA
ncbi:MAG TPA: TetR/AcrR family transcriptional regulator [Nocardia sp.]|uniref:TetR/AcrR family transcriptional regulator n=1 Tax=Nocardia sp. TaxID=1821 RepID=UPI002B4B28D4|nr:TetR/AcrR family transcriptional regulator [Nocardia sp.]HLS75713.1 TetR/AcrR family transcriptional regulator [Nocardia sp.]